MKRLRSVEPVALGAFVFSVACHILALAGGITARGDAAFADETIALVLLALGFLGPERGGMLDQLGVTLPASSPPATCAGASRSSCGRSRRAARRRRVSIAS